MGIAIGGFAVLVLAAALIYMCGRQKTVTEILHRQSMTPSQLHPNHNSYMPSEAGMSEAQYPNMVKTPAISEARWGGAGTEDGSYRSLSPPPGNDERTGMMSMQQQMRNHLNNGLPSPGSLGYPSPTYYERQEMENTHTSTRLRHV